MFSICENNCCRMNHAHLDCLPVVDFDNVEAETVHSFSRSHKDTGCRIKMTANVHQDLETQANSDPLWLHMEHTSMDRGNTNGHPPGRSRWSWYGCSSLRVRGWCYGWPKTPPGQCPTSRTCPERCPTIPRKAWSHTPPNIFPPALSVLCHSGSWPRWASEEPGAAVRKRSRGSEGRSGADKA